MMEAAEQRTREDRAGRLGGRWAVKDALAEALVRSRGVEVGCVFVRDAIEVSLVEQQDVIEKLPAEAADEPLGDRVHVGCSHRGLNDPNARPSGGAIEGSAVLVVAVTNQEFGNCIRCV